MKKHLLILLTVVMITALFASGEFARERQNAPKQNRYEVVAFEENFETGATGWTHYDGAISPNNWHIYNAGGAQGNVWWMGDPALASGGNIGGYYDHQYLVLDTPQILVPTTNPTLTFKINYRVEGLTGGYPGGYNGWDACNIRISTNNGQSWTPISGTPAYNMTSSYAFGFEHGEGTGIPGWGGNSNGWQNATFSLTAYAGQNVKIRFAFASDPAYSTGDELALFGMMVDDIALGTYTNNGVNDGQMTWASLVPLGGDLWNLVTVADAPSPTHVFRCQNTQGSYNPNMMNYLVSAPVTLPASGAIRADFMLKFQCIDNNTFPAVDYFGWEISPNNGLTWYAMSNPYGTPGTPNYVYTMAATTWISMFDYSTIDGYITDYAGQTVLFRWFLRSDEDNPSGFGFMIDDLKIYNDIYIPEPTNLAATVAGSNVTLTWTAPGGGGGQPGWLHYDSGTNNDGIGLTNGGTFEVAAKWAPDGTHSIAPWVGMNITSVKFYPRVAGVTYSIRIYTGPTGVMAYEQPVPTITINAWNEVVLTTPYLIPEGVYVWVGYKIIHTAGQYPAGCDAGPAVAGWGDMIRTTGSWSSLMQSSQIDVNWNIQAYVTHPTTGKQEVISYDHSFGNRNDRPPTSYKIYRNNVEVGTTVHPTTTYTDSGVAGGIHNYKVTAIYGVHESIPSNVVTVFVLPPNHADVGYDDGTAELPFVLPANQLMAVKYNVNAEVTVKYFKVYIHTIGSSAMILRVYDDDGPSGMPGTTSLCQVSYPVASLAQGWNYIPIPAGMEPTLADGIFYISILQFTNGSSVGLDTSVSGHSYKKVSTAWEPITNGDLMIHAIVSGITESEDPFVLPLTMALGNYPNPFNPETTIRYTVAKAGQTSLTIYNTKGQIVRTLVNENLPNGQHSVVWNGKDANGTPVASGIYFYKLTSDRKSITRKMLLSK